MIILETIIMIALTIISVLMTILALIGTFVIGKDVLQELRDKRKARGSSTEMTKSYE